METKDLPNEELLSALSEILNEMRQRWGERQIIGFLGWIEGTFGKGYDSEEEIETIIDDCKRFHKDPDSFI